MSRRGGSGHGRVEERGREERLVWHGDRNGQTSVKTCVQSSLVSSCFESGYDLLERLSMKYLKDQHDDLGEASLLTDSGSVCICVCVC